ncbi:hypothetical protein DENSPDRAFT_831448 [Dentipellis sp. KUC8613]|nr:hypothetical protein DENSPDRAFT_831448 [Dentipellis sp. KUC8613]
MYLLLRRSPKPGIPVFTIRTVICIRIFYTLTYPRSRSMNGTRTDMKDLWQQNTIARPGSYGASSIP